MKFPFISLGDKAVSDGPQARAHLSCWGHSAVGGLLQPSWQLQCLNCRSPLRNERFYPTGINILCSKNIIFLLSPPRSMFSPIVSLLGGPMHFKFLDVLDQSYYFWMYWTKLTKVPFFKHILEQCSHWLDIKIIFSLICEKCTSSINENIKVRW